MTKPHTSKDLKAAVEKHMAANPSWTFLRAWQETKRTNPEFFDWQDFERPKDRLAAWKRAEDQRQANKTQSAHNPALAQAKRLMTAMFQKDLKDKTMAIMAAEGCSFAQAWTELKGRDPAAFEVVQAAENDDWEKVGAHRTAPRRLEAGHSPGGHRPAPIRVTRQESDGEVMTVQGVASPIELEGDDDREVMLVYGPTGQIERIELVPRE